MIDRPISMHCNPTRSRAAAKVPLRAGVWLKPVHYRTILETGPDVGFFEVHAENYMGAGGAPHRFLEAIRIDYGREYAYPLPEVTAYASAVVEIILPIMLVLGFGTRFAALGVLLMTAVIQLTAPDG